MQPRGANTPSSSMHAWAALALSRISGADPGVALTALQDRRYRHASTSRAIAEDHAARAALGDLADLVPDERTRTLLHRSARRLNLNGVHASDLAVLADAPTWFTDRWPRHSDLATPLPDGALLMPLGGAGLRGISTFLAVHGDHRITPDSLNHYRALTWRQAPIRRVPFGAVTWTVPPEGAADRQVHYSGWAVTTPTGRWVAVGISTAMHSPEPATQWTALATAAPYRNRGYGTAILHAIARTVTDNGYPASASVASDNPASLRMCAKALRPAGTSTGQRRSGQYVVVKFAATPPAEVAAQPAGPHAVALTSAR